MTADPAAQADRRPRPSDIALATVLLVVSWTATVAAADLGPGSWVLPIVLALVQAVPIATHRRWPVAGLLLYTATKPLQYGLLLPVADLGWPVLAYLLVRHRVPRAGLLLAATALVALVTSGAVWAVVTGDGAATGLGVTVGLAVVIAPQLAVAGALGRARRAAEDRDGALRARAELARRAAALDAERARIADELGSVVLLALQRLVNLTERLRARLAEAPPGPADALADVQTEARRVLAAMRRVLVHLRCATAAGGAAPPEAEPRTGSRWQPVAPTRDGLTIAVTLAALTVLVGVVAAALPATPELDRLVPLLEIRFERPLTGVLLAVQLGALGWWRSAPLAALAAGTAGSVASLLNGSNHLVAESSWMILVYGVAASAPVLVSAAAVAAATGALLLAYFAIGFAIEFTPVELVGGFLLVAPLWAAGVLRRRARQRAEHRAAQLADAATHAAVHDERHRIARELHDVVAAHVSAIAVQAGAARVDPRPETVDAAATHIEEFGRLTRDALPTLVGLSPAAPPVPLTVDGVEHLVAPLRAAGLPVTARVRGDATGADGDVELFAQRILVEALTNVLRHAGPAQTDVTVAHDEAEVTVSVHDRGPVAGHRSTGEGSGLGLVGMRERTELLGGRLHAGPGAGSGWSVVAQLPRTCAPPPP